MTVLCKTWEVTRQPSTVLGRHWLARVGRVRNCTAPQGPARVAGPSPEERPTEGKLQEQFSSMRDVAAWRKDIVCSPYPLGTGQSLKLHGTDSSWILRKPIPVA